MYVYILWHILEHIYTQSPKLSRHLYIQGYTRYPGIRLCMANPSDLATQIFLAMGVYVCISIYATNPSYNLAHIINPRYVHMHVRMCRSPSGPVEVRWSSMMTWLDFLFQSHIIVNPNNVVWFSIRTTTHLNLTCRTLPYGWNTSIQTLLQIDIIMITWIINHHPIGPTHLGSFVCLCLFCMPWLLFSRFVFPRLSTLDYVW
jgi:hypothetical protein